MFIEANKNLDTAFEWHKINGNTNGMYWTHFLSCWVYNESGNYEKAFEMARSSLNIAIQNNNNVLRKGGVSKHRLAIYGYWGL
jgi:hypothetical protein